MQTSINQRYGTGQPNSIYKAFILFVGLILASFFLFRQDSKKLAIKQGSPVNEKNYAVIVSKMFANTNSLKNLRTRQDINDVSDSTKLKQTDWFRTISQTIEKGTYNLVKAKEDKSFASVNHAQGLSSHYSVNHFSLEPLVAKGETKTNPNNGWELNIKIKGLYADGHILQQPSDYMATASSSDNNAEFKVGSKYSVQYLNDDRGVRQNFIINEKPSTDVHELRVIMHADGDWVVDQVHDRELHFAKKQGKNGLESKIIYNSLKAWDANGKELVAKMEVKKNNDFEIIADVKDASFPVTIDPLSTSPSVTVSEPVTNFGWSVASAGDINGDGYSDVIVGDANGHVYIFNGSASGLSLSANTTLTGAGFFGTSVATAGDVNGDGISDVIIGDAGGNAFIFHGVKNTGIPNGGSATSNTIISGLGSTGGGSSVASAGDVNGDGYSDVIVAMGIPSSSAQVYYGSSSGISLALPTVLTEAGGTFGLSVASAGDINGDGYSDVIVGDGAGKAYVFLSPAGVLSTAANKVLSQAGANFGWSVSSAGDANGDGYSDVVVGDKAGNAYLYLSPGGTLSATAATTFTGGVKFGTSVACAGDVNGDGYSDIIIGGDDGTAYVFNGSSTWPATIANTAASTSLSGSGNYGLSVASAGDINGDGYSDVVVGAPNATLAYTYLGSPSGSANTNTLSIPGQNAFDRFGISINGAGDVNGDGYSDVIVGANGYNNIAGAAYVFYGSPTGLQTTGYTLLTITHDPLQEENFGWSVAGAGDVNGDGYDDIVIGAKFQNNTLNGNFGSGVAYIFVGSVSGVNPTPTAILNGMNPFDWFGASVSGAGDVNGDGYSDVIIGSLQGGPNQEGAAYIYMGGPGGITSSTPADTLYGPGPNSNFGNSVASAGDVDGDGYSDVIVGAYHTGSVYIFKGSATGISNKQPVDYTLSEPAGQNFGISVAGAGDVNGDGYGDVIVGASNYDQNLGINSFADVFYGGPSGPSSSSKVMLTALVGTDQFGATVASAGDVNGDGYSDVIVRATRANSNSGANTGAAYIYLGSATGISNTIATSFLDEGTLTDYELPYSGTNPIGASPPYPFHHSVASAGDVNGDGYSDVLVGVYEDSSQGTKTGIAYAYYGNNAAGHNASNLIRLYQTDLTSPLGATNVPLSNFGLGLYAQSPFGTVKGRMVWETESNGTPFSSGGSIGLTTSTSYTGSQKDSSLIMPSGTEFKALVNKDGKVVTRVRARIKYASTAVTFGQRYSPWIYGQVYLGNGNNGALPVDVTKFTASVSGENIVLNWQTANEINMYSYIIEHSLDGTSFDSIGTVLSKGNPSGSTYDFTHLNPGAGKHYYRLREVNMDGKFTRSQIVWATLVDGGIELKIYPNPANDYIIISTRGISSNYARLINAGGAVIGQYKLNASGQTTISLSGLAKGNYFVEIVNSGFAPKQISIQ